MEVMEIVATMDMDLVFLLLEQQLEEVEFLPQLKEVQQVEMIGYQVVAVLLQKITITMMTMMKILMVKEVIILLIIIIIKEEVVMMMKMKMI